MNTNQHFKMTADLHRTIVDSIKNTVESFVAKDWCDTLETITADLGQAIRRFDEPVYPDLSTFMMSPVTAWGEMLPHDPTSAIKQWPFARSRRIQMTIGEPRPIGPDGILRIDGNRPMLDKETGWFLNQMRIASGTREHLSGILLPLSREVLGSLTWATLIQYLQFVKDHSNFTSPLMNFHYPEGATTEEKAQVRMSAHAQYVYDRVTIDRDSPIPLHEMFNEEREEGLEGLVLPGQDSQEQEPDEEQEQEQSKFTKDEKKDAIRKVMDILDEKISDLLLEAEDYKKYAAVLGEVFKEL